MRDRSTQRCSCYDATRPPVSPPALTTWQAFLERARLKAGEHVLIQAGAGGVGSFAIQLAKHLGAEVTATASAVDQSWMAKLGADRTIDYATERFEEAGPFDVVYDGLSGPLVERGIQSLKPGGRYVGLVRVADAQSYREIGFPDAVAGAPRACSPSSSRPRPGAASSTAR